MQFPVGDGSKLAFERDWYIAQGFGNPTSYGYHEGLDINLRSGGDSDLNQPLKMIADGKIFYYHFSSHPTNTFGRHLVYRIDGPWGSRWVHCAHCTDQDFKTTGEFPQGAMIARLGKSGTPYAHLHFSVFKVDPATLGGGIDNIANTQTELNQVWEDPLTFINTWIGTAPTPPPPQPPPVTDQSRYDFGEGFGVMELQQARSVMRDQRLRLENSAIFEQKINQIRAIVV